MCFSNLFNWIKKEILALKTIKPKTASVMKTQRKSVSISLPLTIYAYQPMSSRAAIIKATSTDGSDMLASCTLKGVSTLNNRIVIVQRTPGSTGVAEFAVFVAYGNSTDLETLRNGGSVTVNFNVDVTATSDINLGVSYKTLWS